MEQNVNRIEPIQEAQISDNTSNKDAKSPTSNKDAKSPTKNNDNEAQIAPYDRSIETTGNTKVVMAVLSEMWLVNLMAILGGTYCMTFLLPQGYVFHSFFNDSSMTSYGIMVAIGNYVSIKF
jgi:hypothetical protein